MNNDFTILLWGKKQFSKANAVQFTLCKYNCIMPFQSFCWCLQHIDYAKMYFHAKLTHQITLVKCLWISDLIRIFSIRRLMKWVMDENSISWCLLFFPFNQIYTTKVCRNYPRAIIKFVELQVRTFFSIIIIFNQFFLGYWTF